MRTLLLCMIALSLFGQAIVYDGNDSMYIATPSNVVIPSPSTGLTVGHVRYIVKWTTREKRYECPMRTALGCIPDNPGCNVPDKDIEHFTELETRQAVERLLAAMPSTNKVVSVYEVKAVPFRATTKEVEERKSRTVTTYELEGK